MIIEGLNDFTAEIIRVWNTQMLSLRTVEHLYMFFFALFFSILIGVVTGVLTYRNQKLAGPVLNGLNVVETVPDVALLVLLLPIFGIGAAPTIVASILYSILPIARNTYTGLSNVPREYIEIAEALGLTPPREVLFKVRFPPLSLPLVAGGVRIAVVFTMGGCNPWRSDCCRRAWGLPFRTEFNSMIWAQSLLRVPGWGLLAVLLDGIAGIIEKILKARYGTWS